MWHAEPVLTELLASTALRSWGALASWQAAEARLIGRHEPPVVVHHGLKRRPPLVRIQIAAARQAPVVFTEVKVQLLNTHCLHNEGRMSCCKQDLVCCCTQCTGHPAVT